MKYHLIALFTVMVWGTTFVSTKVLLDTFTPLWILLIRFAIGTVALCALRPHILKLKERRHEWLFIFAGATGIAAYYLLENIALVFTSATAVGVIVAASPLFTGILSRMIGVSKRLSVWFFAGFAVAMAGLILVSWANLASEATNESAASLIGDTLALLAGLIWAIYSLLVNRISELGYETIAATKRTFLWGLVFIVPFTIPFGGSPTDPLTVLEPQNSLNLLFLGFIASAACFVTWTVSVKHLGATISTTYIYLVPAITATSSILILGEPFTVAIVAGLALTIAGLFLSQRGTTG